MPTTDDYFVEAVKTKIADDVTDRVHERIRGDVRTLKLFGRNAAIIAAVVGALAVYFHKDIFGVIVTYGSSQLEERVRSQVADQLKALDAAHFKSDAVRTLILKEQDLFTEQMFRHRDELNHLKDDYTKRRTEVTGLIKEQGEASETTRQRIAEAQMVALAEIERSYVALLAKIADLRNAIEKDAEQKPTLDPRGSAVAKVELAPKPIPPDARKPTVYFQFAGFTREDAVSVSNALKEVGKWTIPGEERTSLAIKTNEIRYHAADEEAAKVLEKDANQILQDRYRIAVIAKQNPRAKAGFLEMWIYRP